MIETNKGRQLIKIFNTPFYVFDEDAFESNYFHLRDSFLKEYDKYQIAYSFKTNYTPYICGLVKKYGGFAEVVSDMELKLAYSIGFKPNEIIFNGPVKGQELEEHLLKGGIANLDCEEEVDRIISISKKSPQKIKIGLRLNFDIGANYVSRFGFDIKGDSFARVIQKVSNASNISIAGIHCHISRARGLNAWEKRIETLLEVSEKLFDNSLEYIDIGSGMFGDMDEFMRTQFSIPIPSYEEYAAVVAKRMREHFKKTSHKPLLISEPGTTVISRYISLFTKVVQVKRINNQIFATVDASYQNAGEACEMKKLPHKVYHACNGEQDGMITGAHIMGYTCLEQDCLYHDLKDSIGVGSIIEFGNVGGYSIVYKPPFIRPNCSIIAVSKMHDDLEIKRRETEDDIFRTFKCIKEHKKNNVE